MELAMIGLGRMGGNMTRRLSRGGHRLVVYDVNSAASRELSRELDTVTPAASYEELLRLLDPPRTLWMMLPHPFVDDTIAALLQAGLTPGDLLVDGGNSNYKDSMRRGKELAGKGIFFVDCGTSGGVWGLENGYSLMLGGEEQAVSRLQPALITLAANEGRGWGRVGGIGAGHFVKMVHNGIEYGMMQALGEGFELMHAKEEFALDLNQIAHIWRRGAVVSSWLLDLIGDALERDGDLSALSDWMDDSGEGRWCAQEAVDLAVPAPVMTLALHMRFRSRRQPSFAGKIVNAMRAGFGGHAVKKSGRE
jgi:6-phosphogluconate dehydrogenase (decarboxylating)